MDERAPAGKVEELSVTGIIGALAAAAGIFVQSLAPDVPGLGIAVSGAIVGFGAVVASIVRDSLAKLNS